MDQIFTVTLTEKINERVYSLNLPIGAPWSEAVEVAKFFSEAVTQLAADAEKQAADRAAAQEPVESVAGSVEAIAQDSVEHEQEPVESPAQEVTESVVQEQSPSDEATKDQ